MASKKVAVLSAPSLALSKLLEKHDIKTTYYSNMNMPDDPALLIFCDGPPVTPIMWNQKGRGHFSGPFGPSFRRDMREHGMFRAFNADVPRIGIGRGALLLNALNFGRNYTGVEGHMAPHPLMNARTGQVIDGVESNHHQLMQIGDVFEPTIFFVSSASTRKWSGNNMIDTPNNKWLDNEIMFYPETSSLCWQPSVSSEAMAPFFNAAVDSLVNTGDLKSL